MTQAGVVDILTQNAGEVVRLAQARDLAANVVQAIFRVVKLSTLHAIDNQAMVRQVEESVEIIRDYGQRADQNVSILFARGSVFVGGQLLKASRAVYEGALELGEVLKQCGASELHVARDVRAADFYAFASALAEVLRSPTPQRLDRPSPRIRLRQVSEAALVRGMDVERLDPDAAMVRMYASAVVIMRRFFEELVRGRYRLPQRVKRVAQRLVDLSAGETPAFLGVTAVRNANHDDAGRAVNTAILSVAIARQISDDPVILVRLAMAALLYDTARPRLAGRGPGTGIIPQLSEQQDDEVPAGTAVALTALGRVNEPSVMRTVIAYEAHWVKRQARLGALYRGLRQPTLQARIIASARAFNDLLTPAPGQAPLTADEAVAALEQATVEAADRTVLRLLVGALGIFPTGTLVELSTGEVALVVQTPSDPARYSQPRVRLVFDSAGGAMDRAVEVDLAEPVAPGHARRHIRRVVATSDDAGASHLRSLAGAAGPGVSAVRPQPTVAPSVPPPRHSSLPPRAPLPSSPPVRPTVPASYGASHTEPAPPAAHSAVPRSPGTAQESSDSLVATREQPWSEQLEALAVDEEADTRAMTSAPVAELRMTNAPSSPPTAVGELTRTPLVHLLVYLLDNGLTGSAVFQTPEGVTHCIYFSGGAPAKIRTGTVVEPLDRVILDLGLLDEATLRETLREVSRTRILHGRHLVARGLLDRETVLSVLKLQLVRKLMHLFELSAQTRYAYYESQNLLESYGGPELTPCEPLAAVMAGVRLRGDDPLVDATLERIATRRLGLHPAADMRRFELQRQESAVVDLLRTQRMTLAELLGAGLGQDRVVRLAVYALAITRHLDLGVPAKPPVGLDTRDTSSASAATSVSKAPAAATQDPARAAARPHPTEPAPAPSVAPRAEAPVRPSQRPPPPPDPRVDPPTPASAQRIDVDIQRAAPAARTGFGMSFGQGGRAPRVAQAVTPDAVPARATSPVPATVARNSDYPSGKHSVQDVEARRLEIEVRSASIGSDDYFQMLGVGHDATHEQIQSAYFALAKSWHPDRQPAELADLKQKVAGVFARLNEAYQTLTDPQRRLEYAKTLELGGGSADEQQHIARVVDAALEFQKAEILLKKHDLSGAEALAARAVQADPEQPEYLTLLVWIQAQRRGEPASGTARYDDLIRILDGVLHKEPRYERALFYRGMLLKRIGRTDKALKDFRLSAEINPKNLDAVREVRLHEMRRRSGGSIPPPKGAPPAGGIFGKLFKK